MNRLDSTSLGILTVATNIYIDYWRNMVLSLDKRIEKNQNCVVHIFTDQPEKAKLIQAELVNLQVQIHVIPSYGWPDATIRRYEIFSNFASNIGEKVLMHLDADMLVVENFFDEITSIAQQGSMILVAHPGFWNKKVNIKRRVIQFLLGLSSQTGSWEQRKESEAFVERKMRKAYVCGGAWAGNRNIFFEMVDKLSDSVAQDSNNGVTAVWHDESHLNKWASENKFLQLSPSYCYVMEYKHLKGLTPKIIAVTKEARTR